MTITWEELQKMNVPSIRSKVKSNKPPRKELDGAKFNIEQLFDKEIYIVDWLFIDKSTINKEKPLIKLQFYYNGIKGVVYTTADDIYNGIKQWQDENGGEIKPIKDTIIKDGMSIRFKDIGEISNVRTSCPVPPPVSVPDGIFSKVQR